VSEKPGTNGNATGPAEGEEEAPLGERVKRAVIGAPRDLSDRSVFQHLSLIPLLAWVGLGADGLSSSSYGPEEAFRTLVEHGGHTYLAVGLAVLMVVTVLLISLAYSRIIEEFPYGGGYVVATKLLGERAGVVAGCALLVDYILTITVSIAAAGDALFSFLPEEWKGFKVLVEVLLLVGLSTLNLRGVKESVTVLAPIFMIFLVTHAVVIVGGVIGHASAMPETIRECSEGFQEGLGSLGLLGMALLFLRAFSLGGGTYTGIEAVSNGLAIMREPRVQTAKRTMAYMAASLAFTASGLMLCYLLWDVGPEEGKTMNAVLVERLSAGIPGGHAFWIVTLASEGALLVVAAQAGFIAGPRVLASMAIDSWVPHRFAALSDRLTTQNGVLLMGGLSLAALVYTGGDIHTLVVMYSINVFLTFSMALFGMTRKWYGSRRDREHWKRRTTLFAAAFALCATILGVTVVVKFGQGGWLTLVGTACFVAVCLLTRRHYRSVAGALASFYDELKGIRPTPGVVAPEFDPKGPTAAVLVAGWGGVGIHTALSVWRVFPGHFKNLVFLSVGVIDSGTFKGHEEMDALRKGTEDMLRQYVDLARGQGIPAVYRLAVGTDAVHEAEALCQGVAKEFHRTTFFGGRVIFRRETWYQRLLHNETAMAIQRRLHWAGITMVVLPVRVQ